MKLSNESRGSSQRQKRSTMRRPRAPQPNQAIIDSLPTKADGVSVKVQKSCIKQVREILNNAQAEYSGALVEFDQTSPTDERFTAVTDRLQNATTALVTARENFKICCATI